MSKKEKILLSIAIVLVLGVIIYFIYNDNKTITVKFDMEGGTPIVSEIKTKKGTKITRPNNPMKEDHIFVDWTYNNSSFNFDTPITEDITLVAHWNLSQRIDMMGVTITFIADNSNVFSSAMALMFTKIDKPIDVPTKEGYTFKYWSKDGVEFNFDNPIETDTILYAVYENNTTHELFTATEKNN